MWSLRIRRADGKRQRVELGSVSELRSEAAARRAGDAWLSRNQPGQLQAGEPIGFADYAEAFLDQHAALYRASTRRHYATIVRRHLVPEFGGMPLWRIGVAEIREVLARRRTAGLRRSTLQGIRAVLLQLLRQARIDGYDAQEIAPLLVRLPREDIAEREQRHITAGELDQILEASPMPWRAVWAVMGLAGLRISEALGLAWPDIDLGAAPLLRIRQGASGGQLLPLKTRTSRADLPIDARLKQILCEYLFTYRPNKAGLLFATRTGRPMAAEDIRRRQWKPLLQRLGIAHAGFHALRHGLPRRLFAAGCSAAVVRQLMRHGSLAITERYTHTTAEDLRAAINAAHPRPTVTQVTHAAQENKP
jgi:integrase